MILPTAKVVWGSSAGGGKWPSKTGWSAGQFLRCSAYRLLRLVVMPTLICTKSGCVGSGNNEKDYGGRQTGRLTVDLHAV